MKKKIMMHLVTLLAITALVILDVSSGTMQKNSKTDVEISWDEGLTSGVTRITNDKLYKNWVKASPDGTKLLYTEASKSGNWTIMYLRDANNPSKTPLIGEIAYSPSWYEDSTRFLYISYEGGSGRLVRSSVTGGGKTYISRTAIGDGDDTPIIRDGMIVCTSWVNNQWQIVIVKENGTEPTFLGEGRSPSWHPTEDKIVFIKNTNDPGNSGGDIYEMDMNSGQITQVYSDPQGLCYSPSFSPDGRRILFVKETGVRRTGTVTLKNPLGSNRKAISYETQKTHVFVMNSDGTNVSPISGGTGSVSSPCWGKDGEIFCLVGIAGQAREIYKLRIRD
jgi:Tol biopolymer transport system component